MLKIISPGYIKEHLTWWYRRTTAPLRALPDFIIAGAQKSGTTSLHFYLQQHPQIIASGYRKEIHYFDGGIDPAVNNYLKGEYWYRSFFPVKIGLKSDYRTFEASPLYLFNPFAPGRMSELIPKVKLIFLLRNPVERAISHFFHEKNRKSEGLPFLDALKAEELRLEVPVKREDFKNHHFINSSYKSRGQYAAQIERYLNYFPFSQMLVIQSEEFFDDPDKVLKQVFEFVGVDSRFKVPDLQPMNVTENRYKVDRDVYQYLEEYFYPNNQRLFQLLGKKFDW